MSFLGGFKTLMHQEPVIVWSFIIGGIGEYASRGAVSRRGHRASPGA